MAGGTCGSHNQSKVRRISQPYLCFDFVFTSFIMYAKISHGGFQEGNMGTSCAV